MFIVVWSASFGQSPVTADPDADSLFTVCARTVSSNPEEVINMATQLLAQGKKQNDSLMCAKSRYFLGKAYRYTGDLKKALGYLTASIPFFRQNKDALYECSGIRESGIVYYLMNENEEALRCYTSAMAIARENGLTEEVIAINNNIGTLFDTQRHYDKAITHYEESLRLNSDDGTRALLLSNMAKAQLGKGMLNDALRLYQESQSICATLHDVSCAITALRGMASVYWNLERNKDVLIVSDTLLKLQAKAGLKTDQIETYNLIGLAHLNLNNSASAIRFFQKALAATREVHYPNTHYVHANLAFAYEQAGLYQQAYDHFVKHKHLQDSVENIEKEKQLEELLAKYETDKKEQQIVLLQREKQLQELELQKQQAALDRQALIRNIIIIAAFLLLIPVIILLIFYRQKMHSKMLLSAKTEEVNRQHTLELIRSQEFKTIKANLEGREKERARIARELHDGVAGSLAGIKLHLIKVSEACDQLVNLQKIIRNVDTVYEEVRTISHNLNPPTIHSTAFIDLLRNQLTQLSNNGLLTFNFVCYPEESLNRLSDALKIEVYRILQELSTNIIKHAEADFVEVQFTRNEDSVNLIVEDTGKGFDPEKVTYGQGLANIRARVAQVAGKLHLESTPGRGTIVNIDIPVPEEADAADVPHVSLPL